MYTPLHVASVNGQISVVKLLLELGVEVDAVNNHGNTSLHLACLNGQDVVVGELLRFDSSVNSANHYGLVSSPIFCCNDENQNYEISQSVKYNVLNFYL